MEETTVTNLSGRRNKKLAADEVYIGRRLQLGGWDLPESPWANPYRLDDEADREKVIRLYKAYVKSKPALMARLHELKGKKLACWCHPKPCHGDVLRRLLLVLE